MERNFKCVFWNIDGKNRFTNLTGGPDQVNSDPLFYNSDVIFLCETWTQKACSFLRCKNFVGVDATPTTGRSSGGLDMYFPTAETKCVLSSSEHHICIKTSELVIIGVYYKPSLDFDDKVLDLVIALNSCFSCDLPIMIGGDFNLHTRSSDFIFLEQMLMYYNISLISDPSIKTFIGPQGSSTPDHIFCSAHPKIMRNNVVVENRFDSIHKPLVAELILSTNTETQPEGIEPAKNMKLNIDETKSKLANILSSVDNPDPDELLTQLSHVLSSCTYPINNKRSSVHSSHNIAQLRTETAEAFKLYQKCPSPFMKELYFSLRKKLYKEIRVRKSRLRDQ